MSVADKEDSEKQSQEVERLEDATEPKPPALTFPDGGLEAWLQVLGNFFLFMNSWGVINSYGVFLTYYTTTFLPDETPSALGWIGSVQTCLLMLLGAFVGRMVDAGHFKLCIIIGSFLMVFGMMMTSLASNYYQIFLPQGICVGIGSGLLFLPGVAVLSTWFHKRRATAVGISATGSSLGGVIFPIMIRRLIPAVGFPWAVRIMAFVMLATLSVSIAIMKQRLGPRKSGPLWDLSAFRERPYMFFLVGGTLAFMGLWTPFFYVGNGALRDGISSNMSFYLLSIMNAASVFGRVLPNVLADRTGPLNILLPASLASGILSLCWIRIHNLPGLIVFAILYGFVSGAFVSLPPAVIASITTDFTKLGVRLGMMFSIVAIGLLVGPPISGALVEARHGDFWGAQLWAGLITVAGGAVMIGTRVSITGWKLKAKA